MVNTIKILLLTGLIVNLSVPWKVFAQTPQKMSYQAVIRNSGGQLVTQQKIGVRISIIQGSEAATPVYTETHTPTTNANGLVSLEIGSGTIVTGDFTAINWADGVYFIKTETDPTGGMNYTITGISQMLSVPYALYSNSTGNFTEKDPVFEEWDKSTGISIPASQVSDFQATVSANSAVLANTAKVTNAMHTGDATGSAELTVTGINGTPLKELETGILKNTTSTGVPSIALPGTDYLTPTGSAALLTDFPVLNQNTTGIAATVTTNANLTGMVTSVGNETTVVTNADLTGEVTSNGNETTISNDAVINKLLTGFNSGSGSVTATDNILQAIQKIVGNSVHVIGESYGGGIVFFVYDHGRHGLIAATTDQSDGIRWYAGTDTFTMAYADGIGAGQKNTVIIIANQGRGSGGAYAASVCNELSVTENGVTYGDWYLPSKYELNLLFLQKDVVGGFSATKYWSSTENFDLLVYLAWSQSFADGSVSGLETKDFTHNVRAIRRF